MTIKRPNFFFPNITDPDAREHFEQIRQVEETRFLYVYGRGVVILPLQRITIKVPGPIMLYSGMWRRVEFAGTWRPMESDDGIGSSSSGVKFVRQDIGTNDPNGTIINIQNFDPVTDAAVINYCVGYLP